MVFLQPWVLVALPLIALPIVIHLIHQWRYQTRPWAAMMFLLQAQSTFRGWSKLRSWIVLLMRAAVIAGLLFAISRPLTSGVTGWYFGGQTDLIIVAIDTSPSMGQLNRVDRQSNKFSTAIAKLRNTLGKYRCDRWTLIPTHSNEAIDYKSLDELIASEHLTLTDTSSNYPETLASIIRKLKREAPTNSQVWIVGDNQATAWMSDSGTWDEMQSDLQAWKTNSRWTLLDYDEPAVTNSAVQVISSRLEIIPSRREVELVLSVEIKNTASKVSSESSPATTNASDTMNARSMIPVTVHWKGKSTSVEVECFDGFGSLNDFRMPIAETTDQQTELSGLNIDDGGYVSIPLDDNAADNYDVFAASKSKDGQVVLVANDPETVSSIVVSSQIATNHFVEKDLASTTTDDRVRLLSPDQFATTELDEVSLLIWQGPLPDPTANRTIEDFCNHGGCLWLFPPAELIDSSSMAQGDRSSQVANEFLSSYRWENWENAAQSTWPIDSWETQTGIFATTDSGIPLRLGEIQVQKRIALSNPTDANTQVEPATISDGPELPKRTKFQSIATYNDGKPFVSKASGTVQQIFAFSTLPMLGYSDLDREGIALYIATSRSIDIGNKRMATSLNFSTASPESRFKNFSLPTIDRWIATGSNSKINKELGRRSFTDQRRTYQLGTYRAGNRLIAIHRNDYEQEPQLINRTELRSLFGEFPIAMLSDEAGSDRQFQNEIWRAFLVLMILALLAEGFLSLPRKIKARVLEKEFL